MKERKKEKKGKKWRWGLHKVYKCIKRPLFGHKTAQRANRMKEMWRWLVQRKRAYTLCCCRFFPSWCFVSIFCRRVLCVAKVRRRKKSYYILVDVNGALDLTQFPLTAKCLHITIFVAIKVDALLYTYIRANSMGCVIVFSSSSQALILSVHLIFFGVLCCLI